jgi:hypothetical protein
MYVAVGDTNSVWGLNQQNQIFHYNPSTQQWVQIPGLLDQIAVAADGSVWGLDQGDIWYFNASTLGWQQVNGSLRDIAVGANGEVWGLDLFDQIYSYR